jgi:hypothetical protein
LRTCSSISIVTILSKPPSSASSFTSPVSTRTLDGARASIHSPWLCGFEIAVIRLPAARPAFGSTITGSSR